MEITSQDIEDMNAATQTKSKFVADVADFTDMRVSEVGYGRDEYKTSKPNILPSKNFASFQNSNLVHILFERFNKH